MLFFLTGYSKSVSDVFFEGGKGGSRSRFTENKTVLSQFTKNKDIMKITVHSELNIYFSFHGK